MNVGDNGIRSSVARVGQAMAMMVFVLASLACAEGDVADAPADANDDIREVDDSEIDDNGDNDSSNQSNVCDDVDCSDELTCHPQSGDCVECVGDDHCGSGLACDDVTHQCVAEQGGEDCSNDTDCAYDEECDTSLGQCVPLDDDSGCQDESDCAGSQVCQTSTGDCVDCVSDTDCLDGEVCDQSTHQCEFDGDCSSDFDCPGDQVCDGGSQDCVGCVDDLDCSGDQVCDASVQECVGCVGDLDCSGEQVCDTSVQECVECVDDSDCGGAVCDTTAQQCVECLSDTDCGPDLVCDDTAQTCLECLDDSDCTDGTCDTTYGVCDSPTTCCSFSQETPVTFGYDIDPGGYDITVDENGDPLAVFADWAEDELRLLTRTGGSWTNSFIAYPDSFYVSMYVAVAVTISPDDEPHFLLGNDDELTRYWLTSNGFWNFELHDESGDGDYRSTAIAFGDNGDLHMAAGMTGDNGFRYIRQEAGGAESSVTINYDGWDGTVTDIDIAIGADGEPAVMAVMDNAANEIKLMERDGAASTWSVTTFTSGSASNAAGMIIGDDDEPWVVLHDSANDDALLWRRDSAGDWGSEIISDQGDGYEPQIAIDDSGDPHVTYGRDDGSTYTSFYARLEGDDWVEYEVGDIDAEPDVRLGVDGATGTPHMMSRDGWLDTTLYYFVMD